ncbi:MAG: hypothetical protein D6798_12540 [Deltaproteobacteria bacterium]|nr:MAG: hypothetical protein D6798_12540 [Deltaproteobacteria bacterium]
MNDIKHTVEDAVSLPSPHDPGLDGGPGVDTGPGFDLERLEYYRQLHARHTLIARIALLTVIVGMLGANMWLTQRNYHSIVVNMDQTRLAQDQLIDQQAALADEQARRFAALEARISALESRPEAVASAE